MKTQAVKASRGCPECDRQCAWLMSDERFKCRLGSYLYKWLSLWDSLRWSERDKRKRLESFVLDVPSSALAFGRQFAFGTRYKTFS